MKLLFTHDTLFRKYNERLFSLTFTNHLWETRYLPVFPQITVIGRDGGNIEKEEADNMKLANAGNVDFDLIPWKNLALAKLLHYRYLRERIKAAIEKCDCLIARVPSELSYLAIKEARRQDKPYMVEVVGCAWDSLWNHSWKGKFVALFSYLAMKRAVKEAKYAIYVTNEFLQQRYPCKGTSIACSNVSLKPFDDKIIEKRISKIENHTGKTVIGTIAAVNVRYKGQQNVIKALGLLKRQGIVSFEYQLVGGGDQEYLKNIACKYGVSEQVKFYGSISHDRVFDWLDAIDIYIQPSLTEGLPRSLVEAMSRGLPCIGSSTGGIPELLGSQSTFRLTHNIAGEIAKLLQYMDVNRMKTSAILNFRKSQEYKTELLEQKRRKFFHLFKNEAESSCSCGSKDSSRKCH